MLGAQLIGSPLSARADSKGSLQIYASPIALTIRQGTSGTSTITTQVGGPFNSPVSLSASGVPSGTTATFHPASIPAPGEGSSTLTLSVTSSTTTGTYHVVATATGGGITRSTGISITVTAANPFLDVSASAGSLSIGQGASATDTITTTVSGGLSARVYLSASGLPSGTTPTFQPGSIPPPGAGTSKLTVAVGSTTPTGSYTMTITAAGGAYTDSIDVQLIVTAAAKGQVTAHNSKLWLGSRQITLRGMFMPPYGDNSRFVRLGALGMNFVRMPFQWTDLEPNPPVYSGGVWQHTYDQSYVDFLKGKIAAATSNGLYVGLGAYDDNTTYFGWPGWLYKAQYNSYNRTYLQTTDDFAQARTDFWSDALRKQFMGDMWSFMAGQLKGMDGIVGYDVYNEPSWGNLPNNHTTTQLILDDELQLAHRIRAVDPSRVIFFMTRGMIHIGLPNADLTGWGALGNVAYDLHDYFGARWGSGLSQYPGVPVYRELAADMFDSTNAGTAPYIGTEYAHEQLLKDAMTPLQPYGIPLVVGEFGDNSGDPGVYRFFGNTTAAMNNLGISWASLYGAAAGIFDAADNPRPWAYIVLNAATAQ
jgi:hypothetical protein